MRDTAETPSCTAFLEDSDPRDVSTGPGDGQVGLGLEGSGSLPATGAWERGGESSWPTTNPVPPLFGSLRDINGMTRAGPDPGSLETQPVCVLG